MGTLSVEGRTYQYQWASDVAFDGIRLEVLSPEGDVLFDMSLPEGGSATLNSFANEVSVALVTAAIGLLQQSD